MRCLTYSQVTTGQPLRCRWCDEDYNGITEHWLRHFPAMVYWQENYINTIHILRIHVTSPIWENAFQPLYYPNNENNGYRWK